MFYTTALPFQRLLILVCSFYALTLNHKQTLLDKQLSSGSCQFNHLPDFSLKQTIDTMPFK